MTQKEIKLLIQCRNSINKTWNLLNKTGVNDQHLVRLHDDFDKKIKDYYINEDAIMKEIDINFYQNN